MRDNLIVKHLAGSKAYGTDLPDSDTDIRGLFIGDPINICTPWYTIKEGDILDSDDAKLYEFHHFFKLFIDQNPNIMETLWVDEQDIIVATPVYEYLRSMRDHFISTKIAHTYTGFAHSQLNRIRGHNKWINDPQPERAPQQVDYVKLVQWFGEAKVMPRDFTLRRFSEADYRLVPYGGNIFGLYGYCRKSTEGFSTKGHTPYNLETGTLNTQFESERELLPPPGAVVKFNEKEYKQAHRKWKEYWEWKAKRNPTRSALEEKFGYDTKHAMHLFRLMKTAHEALLTGKIKVRRPDAEMLLDIRHGKYTYNEVVELAEMMDNQIRVVDYMHTTLPRKVDLKFAANVVLEVQSMMWGKRWQ